MGLWSVWVQWRMVSDPVAKGVGRVPHSCQGGHGHSAMGGPWQSTIVLVRSDNAAALTSGTARDPVLMHLWRCLQFFLAHYDIHLLARHIAGINNIAADALSRDKLPVFFQCQPQANPSPPPLPPALLKLLVHLLVCSHQLGEQYF
jgi:hypothetical protein